MKSGENETKVDIIPFGESLGVSKSGGVFRLSCETATLMEHRQRCLEMARQVTPDAKLRAARVVQVAKRLMRFVEEGK